LQLLSTVDAAKPQNILFTADASVTMTNYDHKSRL